MDNKSLIAPVVKVGRTESQIKAQKKYEEKNPAMRNEKEELIIILNMQMILTIESILKNITLKK